jgi:methionine synthase II (cobalamin-independent)
VVVADAHERKMRARVLDVGIVDMCAIDMAIAGEVGRHVEIAHLAAVRNAATVVDGARIAVRHLVGIFDDFVDEVAQMEHEAQFAIGRRALVLPDHPTKGVLRAFVDAVARHEGEANGARVARTRGGDRAPDSAAGAPVVGEAVPIGRRWQEAPTSARHVQPAAASTGARALATTLRKSASRATSTVSACRSPWSNGRRVHKTSASALSLLYPSSGIPNYPRETFIADLINEAEIDIRGSLDAGADSVQIDFTEARLSLKLDPSGALLRRFIELNNQVLDRFTPAERQSIGVHVCPGGDKDSTHSADVDYAALLPDLFQLNVGRFYLQMASEPDRKRVLRIVSQVLGPNHMVFVGVIDPIDPMVETTVQVRGRVLEAASLLPIAQLGTTDDCGVAPFADDTSTARDVAFSKIRARVEGHSAGRS